MIDINPQRAIISDGQDTYNDSPENLETHSEGMFTGLPQNVLQYMRRDDGVEFWVVEDEGGNNQTVPDVNFMTMMDAVFEMLPTLLSNQTAETIEPVTYTLVSPVVKITEDAVIQVVYSEVGHIPLTPLPVVVDMGNGKTKSFEVTFEDLSNEVNFRFPHAGFYSITIDGQTFGIEVKTS
jgi:hypothetical protein